MVALLENGFIKKRINVRLSTRTRYGTRMMVRLGLAFGEKPVLLKIIAKSEDISEKYLSQIILSLKAAGLVVSFRGAHGGYALSKHPSKIKISDIYRVLEGDFEVVGGCKDPVGCERISLYITHSLWNNMSRNLEKMLTDITLNDLVMQCKEKAAVMYNI